MHNAAAPLVSAGAWRGKAIALINVGVVAALWSIMVAPVAGAEAELAPHWQRLARQADVIVLGECAAERSDWEETGGVITTTIEFRPHRFYKGDLARRLTIKTLGGRVGDESMAASHGAALAAGEQVLLFLERSEFGSYYVVVGGDSGKLVIDGVPANPDSAPELGTRAELLRLLPQSGSGR